MQRDTLLVPLADFHTGSNLALFPNRFWEGKNGINHTPTSNQEKIYQHFEIFCKTVLERRKDRRLIVVVDGDSIEGVHHTSIDVATRDLDEQQHLHIELIDDFRKRVKWQRGDLLYYTRGTELHTTEKENEIAMGAGAQQAASGAYVYDHLELNINGVLVWFVHHGPGAGKGANEGNNLRNWLKDIYWESIKAKSVAPDLTITGHVHTPSYSSYIVHSGGKYRTMHGIILPSWQAKTRYAYKVAPVATNKIGGVTIVISAAGDIRTPNFVIAETESISTIAV